MDDQKKSQPQKIERIPKPLSVAQRVRLRLEKDAEAARARIRARSEARKNMEK